MVSAGRTDSYGLLLRIVPFIAVSVFVSVYATVASSMEVYVEDRESSKIMEEEQARKYALMLYHGYMANTEKEKNYIGECSARVSWNVTSLAEAIKGGLPPDVDRCRRSDEQSRASVLFARSNNSFIFRFTLPEKKLPGPSQHDPFGAGFNAPCFANTELLGDSRYYIQTNRHRLTFIGEQSKWKMWCYDRLGPWHRGGQLEVGHDSIDRLWVFIERMPKFPEAKLTVRRNVLLEGHLTTEVKLESQVVCRVPSGTYKVPRLVFYYIDEQRGFLPLRHLEMVAAIPPHDPSKYIDSAYIVEILDVRKLGRSWWPYHWVAATIEWEGDRLPTRENVLDARGRMAQAMEVKVDRLELRKPGRDVFTVALREEHPLSVQHEGGKTMRIEGRQVTPEDIPDLLASFYEHLGRPLPKKSPWTTVAIVTVAIVFSTTVVTWVGYRWYRRRCG